MAAEYSADEVLFARGKDGALLPKAQVRQRRVLSDSADQYRLFGIMLGLALRFRSLFPVRVAPSVWKFILQKPVSFVDLECADEDLWRGLHQLEKLDSPEDLELTFVASSEGGAEETLCPGGASKVGPKR